MVHISAVGSNSGERIGKVSDVLAVGQEVKVRVVSFDKEKRRIGLSMKEFVEAEDGGRAPAAGRRQGQEREERSFDTEDNAFKMASEELDELTIEDEEYKSMSAFDAAFARAAQVASLKAEGKKFAAKML